MSKKKYKTIDNRCLGFIRFKFPSIIVIWWLSRLTKLSILGFAFEFCILTNWRLLECSWAPKWWICKEGHRIWTIQKKVCFWGMGLGGLWLSHLVQVKLSFKFIGNAWESICWKRYLAVDDICGLSDPWDAATKNTHTHTKSKKISLTSISNGLNPTHIHAWTSFQ